MTNIDVVHDRLEGDFFAECDDLACRQDGRPWRSFSQDSRVDAERQAVRHQEHHQGTGGTDG